MSYFLGVNRVDKKPKSRKEVRAQKRRENFIGREEPKQQFAKNFLLDDPVTVFSVTGEGGVGKSTLLKQFAAIAANQNVIVVICDDAHTSPASAMGHIVEDLAKLKITHSAFDDRYKEYRKMRQEVEGDPKAPRGAIDLIARGLTDAAIKSARHLPGVSPFWKVWMKKPWAIRCRNLHTMRLTAGAIKMKCNCCANLSAFSHRCFWN